MPSPLLVVSVVTPVSTLMAVTFAFGMTAPEGSVTVPFTLPVMVWAFNAVTLHKTSAATAKNRIAFIWVFISLPPSDMWIGFLLATAVHLRSPMHAPCILRNVEQCLLTHSNVLAERPRSKELGIEDGL